MLAGPKNIAAAMKFDIRYHLLFLCLLYASVSYSQMQSAPVVVELFTSQGCYSCPPAEAFLGELATTREDVLPLEFHVDYWDELVYGAAGKWKDVHSSPEHTKRQRQYNQGDIAGRQGVYTPQIIVQGLYATVGSSKGAVLRSITRIQDAGRPKLSLKSTLSNGVLEVDIVGESKQSAAVWLVFYYRKQTTQVTSGENNGKTLTSHNVVTQVRRIGDWSGDTTRLRVEGIQLNENQSCALLVQGEALGEIFGAQTCPVS